MMHHVISTLHMHTQIHAVHVHALSLFTLSTHTAVTALPGMVENRLFTAYCQS